MQPFRTLVLLCALNFTGANTANAASAMDFGPASYLREGTFALALVPDSADGSRSVATYLPHGTLIFRPEPRRTNLSDQDFLNAQSMVSIGGKDFIKIITQHGQYLYVSSRAVSPLTFKARYGKQSIVFHEDKFLCPEDEKGCDEATGREVRKGDVFEISEKTKDFVRLNGRITDQRAGGDQDQSNDLDGYISSDTYDMWQAQGILTDASMRHPRYLLRGVTQFKSLSTGCGQIKTSIDAVSLKAEASVTVSPAGPANLIGRLLSIFNIEFKGGVEVEKADRIEAKVGTEKVATAYWRAEVQSFDQSGISSGVAQYYISMEQVCLIVGLQREPIYINNVSIKESNRIVATLKFSDFYPGAPQPRGDGAINNIDPQFQIYKNIKGRSFLTSINTPSDYQKVIRKWQSQFDDASIAAIFMQLFNVSCPDKKYAGKNLRQVCASALKTS